MITDPKRQESEVPPPPMSDKELTFWREKGRERMRAEWLNKELPVGWRDCAEIALRLSGTLEELGYPGGVTTRTDTLEELGYLPKEGGER